MPHSIFGWSYPPGCYGPPEPDEPISIHCEHCGAFLPQQPDKTENWEQTAHCDGKVIEAEFGLVSQCGQEKPHEPHDECFASGHTEYRTCSKCGKVNKETIC